MTAPAAWTDLKAIIVDAEGPVLTCAEEDLFRAEKPAGFILFRRNCVNKQQVTELVQAMRACVGRDDLPVLIDQEGGSVARLKEPEWKEYPPAKTFGDLARQSRQVSGGSVAYDSFASLDEGFAAARHNAFAMARDLADMGITVNCAPVVDVPAPDCHEFLAASRTYCEDAEVVGILGEAVCQGLLAGGVTPVIKHIPGHGRARVDSHFSLPVVDASRAELSGADFRPFKYLAGLPIKTAVWAMAAHVVYSCIDPDSPASVSRRITDDIVRGEIGFDGVLIADDVSMKALGGALDDRVRRTMEAGMDMTMLCNASFADRALALSATPRLSPSSAARLDAAEQERKARTEKENR